MMRLNISLEESEAEALAILSYQELRDPRDQAHLIVKRELERRGLLPPETADRKENVQQPEGANHEQ